VKHPAAIGFLITAFAGAGSAWAGGTGAVSGSCEQLSALKIDQGEITSAVTVAKGGFTPPPNPAQQNPAQQQGPPPGAPQGPGGNGRGNAPAQGRGGGGGNQQAFQTLPAFCRVQATLRPSSDSDIRIEVWLPAEGWNGRLEETGNGGYMGSIMFNNLALGLSQGYAVTASNTGKEGNNGDPLIGHPEKLIDWGYRAIHVDAVAAKTIISAYYGNPVKYSYYSGCSTGGRQGWVAAEYFPGDFDGLAIGDPANPMTRLQAGSIWSNLVYNKTDEGRLTRDDWNLVRKTVTDRCDAKDGLKDGIVENPLACHFDTKTLLCKNGATANCLTAPKIEVLNKLINGAVNPRTGEQIYPGWPAGTLVGPGGPLLSATAQQDAVDTFRILFNNPNWDYHKMDFDKDVVRSDELGNNVMNGVNPEKLGPLFARGGKILLYHGWNDPAITPLIQIKLYQDAVKANGGVAKTYNDLRLFMVPTMGHCQGGDGPTAFDRMEVISDWVEKGKAPDQIVATHSTAGQVDRSMPLCPYPRTAKYKGTGDINKAENFACVKQ
jgi:feruloyl esterase